VEDDESEGGVMNRRRSIMKKLLVLMLVLGMASWANATLAIINNGDGTVDIECDVTLTTSDYIYATLVIDVTEGTVSGGAIESSLVSGNGDTWQLGIGDDAEGYYYPVPSGMNGVYMNELIYTGTFASGTTLFEGIDVTLSDSSGTIYVYIIPEDFSNYGTMDDSLLIPEPMTIALLGLGGLFLRRRR
jgi:hypothetical protein